MFTTGCASSISHLQYVDITKCVGGEFYGQEPRTHALMLSLKAIPHLSHLMGLASQLMSTPTAMRGACEWGDKDGVSAANDATGFIVTCWLTPFMGSRWPRHGCDITGSSTSVCMRVCACMFVRVCLLL